MLLDRPADVPFLAVEVSQYQPNLERVARDLGCLRELLDRLIDLVGDEEVQTEDVVGRLARAPPIDPAAVLELVALPRLADRQAGEQCQQPGDEGRVCLHQPRPPYSASTASQRCWARRTSSINSRAAPCPPAAELTQWTVFRTSAAASAGAADRPARRNTGRSSRS